MRYFTLIAVLFLFLTGYSQDSVIVARDTVAFSRMSYKDFLLQAQFENKPYFIVFGASWCAPCQQS